jgi:hypothetical protein
MTGKPVNAAQHWNRHHEPDSAYRRYTNPAETPDGILCPHDGCDHVAETMKALEGHRHRNHKGERFGGYNRRFANSHLNKHFNKDGKKEDKNEKREDRGDEWGGRGGEGGFLC